MWMRCARSVSARKVPVPSQDQPAARGGDKPAVTDELMPVLDPDNFAGGSIPLHADAAQAALLAHVGTPLEMDGVDAAFGVAEMVDENMANAARVHAVENGEDLSDYTMIAFGGAAPLHAARLCEKLGIARCLVPPGAGVGSAIGFLRAPFSFEANRSVYMKASAFDPPSIKALLSELRAEATAFVRTWMPKARLKPNTRSHALHRTGLGNSSLADQRTGHGARSCPV